MCDNMNQDIFVKELFETQSGAEISQKKTPNILKKTNVNDNVRHHRGLNGLQKETLAKIATICPEPSEKTVKMIAKQMKLSSKMVAGFFEQNSTTKFAKPKSKPVPTFNRKLKL